ncbi:hypothetical protein M8J76_017317 [Diaphorina citri]|nr:hypothetical protein M8J76_017317 [Diaphorina citri]
MLKGTLDMASVFCTDLSQNLQLLSEKARSTTEFIKRLKSIADLLNDNSIEFESQIVAQCDALIKAIEDRKKQLVDAIRLEKESKQRILREQVGSMLIHRVASDDMAWQKDVVSFAPQVSSQVDLTLDDKQVLRSIQQLNFIQMKPAKEGEERLPAAPKAPSIIPEECSAENNGVTIAWQPPPTSYVEGYVLELDDGSGGDFREVYCGKETICTVDGLHFNSLYNARVKAFNGTGEGEYSELIGLQTSEVAWFTMDPGRSAPDLFFSPEHTTVTCDGYEHRVALSVVGFSKGAHYWEFVIDRYDSDTDPSFGIARLDVARDEMLGKDDKAWSMYIDKQRSWFMHASIHDQRTEGGISQGSTVGVLLDLDRHLLRFFVNDEPQGPIAFHNLYGVFYPAVSLNRGVTVTLHTGLEVPPEYVLQHIT